MTKRQTDFEKHLAVKDLESISENDLELIGHYSNPRCNWQSSFDINCFAYFVYNHPNRLHNHVSRIITICKNDPGSLNGSKWNYLREYNIKCCDNRTQL